MNQKKRGFGIFMLFVCINHSNVSGWSVGFDRVFRIANMKQVSLFAIFCVVCSIGAIPLAAAGQNDGICPVHGIKMERVDLRVVYGMPSDHEFQEMRVGKLLFPHGRDYVLAGCVLKSEKSRKGFICPECVKARNAWITWQGHLNELSRASQASLEEFFAIVNSRNVNEAMKSMAPAMLQTQEQRKAWQSQLAAIRSIHVMKIEPASIGDWNSKRHVFKVTLEAYVENAPDAPIPFFGWHDNPNVRWITMESDNRRRWVVAGIATGP